MTRTRIIHREQGSALAWVIWSFVLIAVVIGGFLMTIKFGLMKAPEALASQSWMASFLPAVEEAPPTEETPTLTLEETLKQQVINYSRELSNTQSQVASMKTQLDEKDQTIQARDDEIAKLRDAVNLAANQNINNVALVYEAMEPKEASVILTNLGAERAALILGAMRESKAADVIALMDPQFATQITQLMAGFKPNSAAPTAPAPAAPAPGGSGTNPPGSTPPTGGAGPSPGPGQV